MALALGPLVQFQKKFLGTIYQIWRGSGPIFSPLGPKMWEELHYKGIKWLVLYKGRDTVGGVALERHFGPHFWP